MLEKGKKYNQAELTPAGWTAGDGSGHEGYICWDYFDAEGKYLGPDQYGIEPIFEAMTNA